MKVSTTKEKIVAPKTKQKVWTLEACPACNSKDISTNYFSGEVFCLKCGLVIY